MKENLVITFIHPSWPCHRGCVRIGAIAPTNFDKFHKLLAWREILKMRQNFLSFIFRGDVWDVHETYNREFAQVYNIFIEEFPKFAPVCLKTLRGPCIFFSIVLGENILFFKKAFKISDCILGMLLGVLHSIMHMSRKIAIRWSLIEMRRRRRASLLFPLSFCGSEFYYAM